MARTQSVSDREILQAARLVMERRGYNQFTLMAVAKEVGLSRAAIILRFKSTDNLKIVLWGSMVDEFIASLNDLPQEPGGDSLLAIAEFISRIRGTREGSSAFFADFPSIMENPDMSRLELKRSKALRNTIYNAMPETRISRESAAVAFSAHLTGTLFSWNALQINNPDEYFMERTREWLTLAGIPFSIDIDAH